MKYPKTLIVDLSNMFGGASARVINLMKHFPDGQVALASLEDSPVMKEAKKLNIPIFPVGNRKTDPRIVYRLIKAIKQFDVQVVDTANVQSKFWASIAVKLTGVALVSTLNSWYVDEHSGSLKGNFYQTIEEITNRNVSLCICISQAVYGKLIDAGIPSDKIELIPNAIGIDTSKLQKDRKWLLQTYDLPEDAKVACLVGRLVWAKGIEDLIEAFEQIKERFPNLYCLIIGDGELHDSITEQLNKTNLTEQIRLLGYVERESVLSIVNTSDIFLMPSRSEGTPIALLEAAALGKPILATKAGGIPEMVTHDEHALLVEVSDIDAIANGIAKLVADEDYSEKIARNAQNHIEESFSMQAQVQATLDAYAKAWQIYKTNS